MELDTLSIEELRALIDERKASLNALFAVESPTDEQVEEAKTLSAELAEVDAEITQREQAEAEKANTWNSLKESFNAEPEEAEEVEDEEVEEASDEEVEEAAEEEVEEASTEKKVAAATSTKTTSAVKTLAAKTQRPKAPEIAKPASIVITAAADVPNFSTGQALEGMAEVGEALVSRMSSFSTPSGDGRSENLQHYGVAKFKLDFPDDMKIDSHASENETLEILGRASKESRLEGGSLVASGGWCAPSETFYDLCVTGETLDGILSIPEVQVNRGGMRFTKGPDFSDIYGAGAYWQLTEAQAIAGDDKSCFEVTCPSFTDVRLDAVGICIKAPILTNAGYPEIVQRYLSGSLVAHAHKVNASVISKISTFAGTAEAVPDFTSTTQTTLSALELLANYKRQTYKLGLSETLEVILPYWVRSAIRDDLSLRMGVGAEVITDQIIASHFAARHLNVQFVYDWLELDTTNTTEGYSATATAIIYPAGTFVKGTTDVITLNAVYDAASLAENIYTALFFEQGLLVANVCATASKVTIPIFDSGRVGIANVSVSGIATA